MLFYINIYGIHKLLKTVRFFGPPCIYRTSEKQSQKSPRSQSLTGLSFRTVFRISYAQRLLSSIVYSFRLFLVSDVGSMFGFCCKWCDVAALNTVGTVSLITDEEQRRNLSADLHQACRHFVAGACLAARKQRKLSP